MPGHLGCDEIWFTTTDLIKKCSVTRRDARHPIFDLFFFFPCGELVWLFFFGRAFVVNRVYFILILPLDI